MIKKNNGKIFSLSAGAMSAFMVMAALSVPVYAAENKIEYIYNQSLLDKSLFNGNNVIEQNGAKLTVTNIQATKNRIKVAMELEADRASQDDLKYNNLDIRVRINDMEESGRSGECSNNGDGKLLIEEEIENDEGYPEKGVIRIDAVSGKLGLNGTLKIPVNFTEDFNNVFMKDINKSIDIDGTKVNIERFESNQIETGIVTSQPVDDKRSFRHRIHDENLKFLVNIDGNIYYCNFPSYSNEKDGREYDNYAAEDLTYDKVKNAGEIKIIPVNNTMTDEEIEEFYNKDNSEIYAKYVKVDNGVKYPEKIIFSDGSEGKVNVVREDNKIKVYCSSDSDLKSMLMAVNSYGYYTDNEEYYNELAGRTVYKDKDKDNQYVVEYDDSENSQSIDFGYNYIIYNIDKFILSDEIKIK